jgi:hypothetical protein
MDQRIDIDDSQKGIEAHAIKPPAAGMKPLPEEKKPSMLESIQKAREEEARQKAALKVAKPAIDQINKQLKEEFSQYKASPRDKESRDKYREVTSQLKEFRNQIFERTRTEKPPESNVRHVPQGVLSDQTKRLIFPRLDVAEGGTASVAAYPFELLTEPLVLGEGQVPTPYDFELKVNTFVVSYGLSGIVTITNPAVAFTPASLAVDDYVYLEILFTSGLGVNQGQIKKGKYDQNPAKYIKVNSANVYRPYQQYLYYPIAKVIAYVTGQSLSGIQLSETTQIVQIAKDHVRLEIWTVDGLPMWIPNPGVLINPVL